jgi:hypothetical protein
MELKCRASGDRRIEMVRRICLFLAIGLSIAVAQSDTATASDANGLAKGRVVIRDTQPSQPCPHREIYLMNVRLEGNTFEVVKKYPVTTDENGEWTMKVPPGKYVASVVWDLRVVTPGPGGVLEVKSVGTTTFATAISADVCKEK